MGRVIGLVSGKGGTGKTTTALNLGVSLANFGNAPLVVDTSFHTPNMSIRLGSPKLPHTIHHVLSGENHPLEATYQHPSGMHIIPAQTSLDALKNMKGKDLSRLLNPLKDDNRIIFLDGSPGFSDETRMVIRHSDEIYLVTVPELQAVSDAIRMQKMVHEEGKQINGIIINQMRNDSFELSAKNIQTMTGSRIAGTVPYDENVRKAMFLRQPVVYSHPHGKASVSFKQIAARLIGQEYREIGDKEEESWFSSKIKRFGL